MGICFITCHQDTHLHLCSFLYMYSFHFTVFEVFNELVEHTFKVLRENNFEPRDLAKQAIKSEDKLKPFLYLPQLRVYLLSTPSEGNNQRCWPRNQL